MKKNAEVVPLILNSTPEIFLYGLEVIPTKSEKKFPVAILFHGYTANYRRLGYIANMLLMNGVAVILLNLRGHGKSSGKQKDVQGMQQDLTTIMNYIESNKRFDVGRVLLLGSSLGALIALTAGFVHPNITHIIQNLA